MQKPKAHVECFNQGCGPTSHSTGADVARMSSRSRMLFDNVSGPVNSSVGPLRIHKTVELNVTKQTKLMRTLNGGIKWRPNNSFNRSGNSSPFIRETWMLDTIPLARLIRALDASAIEAIRVESKMIIE